MGYHPNTLCLVNLEWLEIPSDGFKNEFIKWRYEINCFYVPEHKVCKLVKSLYGFKKAPRAWYEKLTEHLLKVNLKHYDLDDVTLFVKKFGKKAVHILVYVDDLLMT